MTQSQFHELAAAAAEKARGDKLVLLEAQSIHACLDLAPVEIQEAPDAAILVLGNAAESRRQLEAEVGRSSAYFADTGTFARILSEKDAWLPDGWSGRLTPYSADLRVRNTQILDIHDFAANLIASGTELDFLAAIELRKQGVIDLDRAVTQAERCERRGKRASEAIQYFLTRVERAGLHNEARSLRQKHQAPERTAPDQLSLFGGGSNQEIDGLAAWRAEQESELLRLALSLGLPVGARAEVTLRNGVRLAGKMVLCRRDTRAGAKIRREDILLRIDKVDFTAAEVETCVRLDAAPE